jgi:flagellar hook assembly protein FlgD
VIDSYFVGGSSPATFNPYANDLLPISFSLSNPGRLSVDVESSGETVESLTYSEPFGTGTQILYWDGRDLSGDLIPGGESFTFFQYAPVGLPENVIITKDETLKVDSLRANAYVIRPVYGEVSKITYVLPRDSVVTLNIKDPNGNHFRNVLTNAYQAANQPENPYYEILWDGTDDDGKYAGVEGHYTLEFFIEDATRTNSKYRRGNVTVV